MKRLAAILSLFIVFFSVASAQSNNLGLRTVVIDAGHGGKDPGAISRDGKTREKNLTLDISKNLAELIKKEYPDVKVVLTRSTDEFIALGDRAIKANKANGSLFISIHINASKNTAPNGISVHVLGQSSRKNTDLYAANMDIVRRENSVITLEEDYNTKYEGFDPSDPESYIFMTLMANANLEQSLAFAEIAEAEIKKGPIKNSRGVSQDPFYVLWKTAMPAVLLELGFISNDSDLAHLRNAEDRKKIVDCIFNAFKKYKKQYDASVVVEKPSADVKSAASKEQQSKPTTTAKAASDAKYGVQIFAGSVLLKKGDKQFLGYEPVIIKSESGKIYKYVIGVSDSKEKTKEFYSEIRKKYPDSYLVEIHGNSLSRWK